MRFAALALTLLPTASAFVARVPAAKRLTPCMAIGADQDLQSGITAPTGYFDPLGLSKNSNADIKKWRENELKHGRIAMLAAVGYLVQERFHPFFGLKDADIPMALTHFQTVAQRAPWFVPALIVGIGLAESSQISRGFQDPDQVSNTDIAGMQGGYVTGDLGLDPFNVKENPDSFMDLRTKELNNGRLAMLAIAGMWLQEINTGRPIYLPFTPEQVTY